MSTSLESFRRLRRNTSFSARFYQKLLGADARIARAFAQTDFEKQHALFEHGLLMLLEFANGSAIGEMAIARLGESHGPAKLNVAPELYAIWSDCLIETARELDEAWSPAIERRFRADLRKGIDEMTRLYHAPL